MFGRRKRRERAFRPSLGRDGGALESRCLLSTARALPRAEAALRRNIALPDNAGKLSGEGLPLFSRSYVQTGVGNGGRAAVMVDTDGELYVAHVTGGGTVRAKAAPGGKVDLIVYGTNVDSVLTIDPEPPSITNNSAHQFANGTALQDGLLHVRNIRVVNGRINQVLGYRTADLSGKLDVSSGRLGAPSNVDRIAFFSILETASIRVSGDLNTLDVYNTLALNGGDGIVVGRDLNFLSVGQSLTLTGGASIVAMRDFGAFTQPAKGTGPAGSGAIIQGDFAVGPGSTFQADRFNYGPIIVRGEVVGLENLPPATQSQVFLQRDGAVFRAT